MIKKLFIFTFFLLIASPCLGQELSTSNALTFLNKKGFFPVQDKAIENSRPWQEAEIFIFHHYLKRAQKFNITFDSHHKKRLIIKKNATFIDGIKVISTDESATTYLVSDVLSENIPQLNRESAQSIYSNNIYKAFVEVFVTSEEQLISYIHGAFGYTMNLIPDPLYFREMNRKELIILHNALVDLPEQFYHLNQLVGFARRQETYINTEQPNEVSIAHKEGYIELTDGTFERPLYSVEAEIVRLIGYFYYDKVLSAEQVSKWDSLSDWRWDREKEIWIYTRKQPILKSYNRKFGDFEKFQNIHISSPSADFSYSFGFYMTNPNYLKSRAPEKYSFLKKIFQGYEYEITTDDKYKFTIHSPTPDVTRPIIDADSLILTKTEVAGITTSIHAQIDIWDNETDIHHAFVDLKNIEHKKSIRLELKQSQGKQMQSDPKRSLSKNVPPGKYFVSQIMAIDKAGNPAGKNGLNQYIVIKNDISDVDLEKPKVNLSKIKYKVHPANAKGQIIVDVTIPKTSNNKKLSFYEQGWCTSISNMKKMTPKITRHPDGSFIYHFDFTLYDEPGPWYFTRFGIGAHGNKKTYNLPKTEDNMFMIPSTLRDTEAPTIIEESIKIEVVNKNKDGTGIKVYIRFKGPTDTSGYVPDPYGNLNIHILSPKGKRYSGKVTVESIDENTGETYYIGEPEMGDHPDNGIYMLEEIRLQDRVGNVTPRNFLKRKIKFDIEN